MVDSSGLRRGQQTANALFGNQASVLVGDFLYSRAFQMMVELKELRILDVLANATNTIAEGEVLQLMNCNNPDTNEADYMEVIYRKTAKLFEAGTRIGAILAAQDETMEQALVSYGRHLGQAFQLVDDALDYDATPEEFGKNIGDDLAEGKPTLPLIYAMAHGSAAERHMIREAIETGGTRNLTSIQLAIETSGGLRYTAERAREEVDIAISALAPLPPSKFRDGLIEPRPVRHPPPLLGRASTLRGRVPISTTASGGDVAVEIGTRPRFVSSCARRLRGGAAAPASRAADSFLPLGVRHAVDELARRVQVDLEAALAGRLDEPLAQAVAAEPRESHELDVLHVLALVEVTKQTAEHRRLELGLLALAESARVIRVLLPLMCSSLRSPACAALITRCRRPAPPR